MTNATRTHPQLLCERCSEPFCECDGKTIHLLGSQGLQELETKRYSRDNIKARVPCPSCGHDNILRVRLPQEGQL